MEKENIELLNVEWIALEAVIPYARNPRSHKSVGVDKVAASIKEYGFRQPIVVDNENVIIAGHARYLAAERLNMTQVPVHRATTLTPQQIKAYRIADNRTHEESRWDNELLILELSDLEQEGYTLQHTAFDVSELDALLASLQDYAARDQNAVPDIPSIPLVQIGDVWQLGDHRLVCGSATDAASYTALLGMAQADMVYTDPPYNVNYQGKAGKIQNDKLSPEQFHALLSGTFQCLHTAVKDGAPLYVSYSEKETETFYRTLREAGFQQSSCLIWVKNQLVLGRGDYHCKHEPIWYGWKSGASHPWHGGRKQVTVKEAQPLFPLTRLDEHRYMLHYNGAHIVISGDNVTVEVVEDSIINHDKPQRSELHPTMKPVSLVEELIKNSSKRGDTVLDAFGGSGTTLIACEKLSRNARLVELDPHYCDVIIRRWQDYTCQKAVNALTGQSYSEVQRE